MDIDDTDAKIPGLLELVPNEPVQVNLKMYRVSWIVEGKRREQFFAKRQWAENAVRRLLDAAEIVNIIIEPLIGEIEVQDE